MARSAWFLFFHLVINMLSFIKNFTLPVFMVLGVVAYFVYTSIPGLEPTYGMMSRCIDFIQPVLIFVMLYIALCKVSIRQLRPRRWHLWLALIQTGAFVLLALGVYVLEAIGDGLSAIEAQWQIIFECAMICMICPTATAASVVTAKLKGDVSFVVTYVCVINLIASIAIPLVVPALPNSVSNEMPFTEAFLTILSKVFPTLILPLAASLLTRRFLPGVARWLAAHADIAFYIWAFSLSLAIAITTKALVNSEVPFMLVVGIALASLLCCVLQFWLGRKIGKMCDNRISAAQSLGQKNTIFAIWVGYTFMSPVTALAGGFYSVWHNVINSMQLYKAKK